MYKYWLFFLIVLLPHLLKSLWVIEKKVKTERTTLSQGNEGKHKYSVSRTGGFPGDSVVKNPPANAGYTGSIPGSGRAPGEGNGNLLQYSCLGNPRDEEPGGL